MTDPKAGEEKPVYCSFCGRANHEAGVDGVIATDNANICNRCVDMCVEIIQFERLKRKFSTRNEVWIKRDTSDDPSK